MIGSPNPVYAMAGSALLMTVGALGCLFGVPGALLAIFVGLGIALGTLDETRPF